MTRSDKYPGERQHDGQTGDGGRRQDMLSRARPAMGGRGLRETVCQEAEEGCAGEMRVCVWRKPGT